MDEKENNSGDITFDIFNEETMGLFLKKIDFSKQGGLVPAIAQDYFSKEVLMLAFMNEEALRQSVSSGYAHYFSRSRNKLWKKGETSGNVQEIKDIFFDCDNDSILLKVIQKGPACHTGHKTCFYSKVNNKLIKRDYLENKDKDEKEDCKEFYSLKLIFDLIKSRKDSDPDKSYVAKLLQSGPEKIGKKLQEESLELILSSISKKKEKNGIIYEAADLMFFYMVFLVFAGVDFSLIIDELKRREGISGIDEKNLR